MSLDSIFRIYSMTKPLASVAGMMLVEDGVIQLTDPISKFLPAFKDMQVSVAATGADGKINYTNVPAAKPIIVQVNGVQQSTNDYHYDSTMGSIEFNRPPPEGSTIDVEYSPSC